MSDDVVDNESVASSSDDATEAFDDRSEAERQRDEYLDALQRLQAEFENYRKRMTRVADDAATRAAGDIVVKLLPALDAFDYAHAHFADAESDEAKALAQTRGLLLGALAKEGLERIDASDVPFDPQVHDAVAHDETDNVQGPIVEEVLRAGYRWKGVVLRPAMVKVLG
jgi:molecular chaperone GrpE